LRGEKTVFAIYFLSIQLISNILRFQRLKKIEVKAKIMMQFVGMCVILSHSIAHEQSTGFERMQRIQRGHITVSRYLRGTKKRLLMISNPVVTITL